MVSPQAFNELFQWLGLASLLLLVLAVYRRLGMMFIDAREFRLEQLGPAVGDDIGDFGSVLFGNGAEAYRLAVFTTEGCSVCDHLVDHLRSWDPITKGAIALSIATRGGAAYRDRLARALPTAEIRDLAVLERALGAAPRSFPFSILADRAGVVVAKVLGDDFETLRRSFDPAEPLPSTGIANQKRGSF